MLLVLSVLLLLLTKMLSNSTSLDQVDVEPL